MLTKKVSLGAQFSPSVLSDSLRLPRIFKGWFYSDIENNLSITAPISDSFPQAVLRIKSARIFPGVKLVDWGEGGAEHSSNRDRTKRVSAVRGTAADS